MIDSDSVSDSDSDSGMAESWRFYDYLSFAFSNSRLIRSNKVVVGGTFDPFQVLTVTEIVADSIQI